MVTLLAQRTAALGVGVVNIDLSGTGESWGDFSDATYAAWLADLAAAQSWLAERDATVTALLGIRFGALLAADFARSCPACEQLLFWQPALSGKSVMTQFLRLRVVADMMSKAGGPSGIKELTAELQRNRSVEVAGYEITPRLFADLSALKLSEMLTEAVPAIDWFQVSMLDNHALPPADQRVIDSLTARNLSIAGTPLTGETFWNTTEITVCEPLLEATLQALKKS